MFSHLSNVIYTSYCQYIHKYNALWKKIIILMTILGFSATAYLTFSCRTLPNNGCDFFHRHNEIQLILAHQNPYYKWKTFTTIPEMVLLPNAPWAYSFALPICWLPRPHALFVFTILEFIGVILLLYLIYLFYNKELSNVLYSLFFTSFTIAGVIRKDLSVGNYVLFCALGVCLMIYFLNKNKQFWAGLAWGLVMIKPQLGVLLFIPLFLKKQYICITTAVLMCCILSLVPCFFLNENPVKLLLQTTELGAQMAADSDRGGIFLLLYHMKEAPIEIIYKVAFWTGVILVCVLSWQVRKSNNWLLLLMPAAVYSSFWVYANLCNLIMLIFIIILLANIIINAKIPLVKMTAFVLWGISILPFPHSIPSVGLFLKYLLTLLAIIFTIVATKKDNSLKLKYFEQSVNPQN